MISTTMCTSLRSATLPVPTNVARDRWKPRNQQPIDDAISSWSAVRKKKTNELPDLSGQTSFTVVINVVIIVSNMEIPLGKTTKNHWPLGWVTRFGRDTLHVKRFRVTLVFGCVLRNKILYTWKTYNLAVLCNTSPSWNYPCQPWFTVAVRLL